MSVQDRLNAISDKKVPIKNRINVSSEIAEAVKYIEDNSDASVSNLVEEGLKKLNVVGIAKQLKKELESQVAQQ